MEVTVDNFTEAKLKKILISFERKFIENQKLRIKHSDSPTKFACSETELFAALDELQNVATQPELYHVLIDKKTIPTLMSLLLHENTDISAKVIGMLIDFTDIDESVQDSTEALIKALIEGNVIELIVSNLRRLDESNKEESQAINNSLSVIDNLVDFDSALATSSSKPLIQWMMKHVKKRLEFDTIKLSLAELLSVLLMNANENKEHLRACDGIDILLQQIAYYYRIAPVTGDEHEYLEQVINCLCTAIMDFEENRKAFLAGEGVELVELVLREKRDALKKSNIKVSIMKLFNHVVSTDKNQDPIVTECCERFVNNRGLRVLFPIFNNPKVLLNEKVKRREYHQVLDEIEEHTAAILLALLKYCQDSELIQRILVKFAECNFEKLSRLMDLHEKYFRLVSKKYDALNNDENHSDADDDDSRTKTSAYFTLRTIDYIILLACYLGNQFETYDPNSGEMFTNRVGKILAQRPEFRHQIRMEVKRHIDEVADSLEEQNTLELLLDYFGKVSNKVISKEET